MRTNVLIPLVFILLVGCNANKTVKTSNLDKADLTLNSIYTHYSVDNTELLRETYPFDDGHKATYLGDEEQMNRKNSYAYLWPYSGGLSAVTSLYSVDNDQKYCEILSSKVLVGLNAYYDTLRTPNAFSSYISSASPSDRFYDDNVWLGLDFCDLYLITNKVVYLDKAKTIWKFIESGTDSVLGGGIYWCEQKKLSKNTCSNAPGAVYALKLFEATNDSSYFYQGKTLYKWVKENLQDSLDGLYYDNINLNEEVNKTKFAYNSGQMLQAASLLYKLTKKDHYLTDAKKLAESSYDYFFHEFKPDLGDEFRLLKKGDIWFTAIMFRGFVELYNVDNKAKYIKAFQTNLDYAWNNMRDANGLFNSDWSGATNDNYKWLLAQFAMVEMYARISELS